LEDDRRRIDAGGPNDLGHLAHEVGLLELAAGDVDADLEVMQLRPAVMPLFCLTARAIQDPAPDVEDEVRRLRDGDELARPDHATGGMHPADERLEAGHPSGRDLEDRLVVEDEIPGRPRPPA